MFISAGTCRELYVLVCFWTRFSNVPSMRLKSCQWQMSAIYFLYYVAVPNMLILLNLLAKNLFLYSAGVNLAPVSQSVVSNISLFTF